MVVAHFQFVRLAYPKFRRELEELLGLNTLDAGMRVAAEDLQCLCEFVIPTVHLSACSLAYVCLVFERHRFDNCAININ